MKSSVELEEQLAENWLLAGKHPCLEGTVSHLNGFSGSEGLALL